MDATSTPSNLTSAGAPRPQTLMLQGACGARLAATAWGDPKAPAVLLLHGFGQTRQAWKETGVRLAEAGYYALAPDARGHGESSFNPDGQYQLDEFVADARKIAADLEQAVLVGASMGGMIGMLAEAEHSDCLLSALVLVDIVPRWSESGVEKILAFMKARPNGFDSLSDAADAIATYLPHRAPHKTLAGLKAYLRPTLDGRLQWHWDPRLLEQVGADSAPYHARLMAAARLLTCPTLLISGGLSDVVDDEAIAEFLQTVPHARHVQVPLARHMVAGDANQAFTDAVLRFLTELRPAQLQQETGT